MDKHAKTTLDKEESVEYASIGDSIGVYHGKKAND